MKKAKKIVILTALSVCCFNLMYGLRAYNSLESQEGMSNLRLFVDVVARLQSNYVDQDKVSTQKLIYGALEGMMTSLDENSRFHEPQEQRIISDETEGHYAGLGIIIEKVESGLRITSVLPKTPASEAGIIRNDILTAVAGESLAMMTRNDALDKLRGVDGSVARLRVFRPSLEKDFDLDVTRRMIEISSVRDVKVLSDGIGYFRIDTFARKTGEDVGAALEELVDKDKCNALVIDLRNNPGGLLDAAVDVCSHFLGDKSLIVYTEGRHDHHSSRYLTSGQGKYHDIPLLILVNENSASASEIVTSSLRDWNRAFIAGTQSYGKGSVQNIVPLRDGSSIRFTIAYYYTKSGRRIDKVGVTPDLNLPLARKESDKLDLYLESYEKESMNFTDTQLVKACNDFKALLKENSWPNALARYSASADPR